MVAIEIPDTLIQNARGVELVLTGKNELSDSKLIEYFANIGMARMIGDHERKGSK